MKNLCLILLSTTCITLQGCVGLVVGTAVDVAIEVAKVPFKVGGAVIDVATGGDDEKNKSED